MEINGVVDKNIICEAIDECGNVNSYLKEAHDSLIHWFISLNILINVRYFVEELRFNSNKYTVFCRRTRFDSNRKIYLDSQESRASKYF